MAHHSRAAFVTNFTLESLTDAQLTGFEASAYALGALVCTIEIRALLSFC
jgi:hypothetical protein